MKSYPANHHSVAMLETRLRQLVATTENLGGPRYEHGETWSAAIDLAQVAVERDRSEALRNLLDELQVDIVRALARLNTGDYGICEDCSQSIPLERLRVLPEATRCVSCERDHSRDPRIKACA